MMEKLAQAGKGGGVYARTLSLYLPSPTKLQCTLQLRGHIHSPYYISTPMYSVNQFEPGIVKKYGMKVSCIEKVSRPVAIKQSKEGRKHPANRCSVNVCKKPLP
jgi:hypothetical protein